jgi:hypothetical protein
MSAKHDGAAVCKYDAASDLNVTANRQHVSEAFVVKPRYGVTGIIHAKRVVLALDKAILD